MALITPQLTYDGFEEADIVVEAVFEGMALKKQVFAEIDKVAQARLHPRVATPRRSISTRSPRPPRGPQMVIGHHFFSPANVMRLLEIVRGKATSPEVIATSHGAGQEAEEGRRAGRATAAASSATACSSPYLREAQFLVEEGASVEDGEQGALRFRHGDGAAGHERPGRARRRLAHSQGISAPGKARRARSLSSPTLLCEMGRYGQKTGARLVSLRREPQRLARPGGRRADRGDRAREPASSGATSAPRKSWTAAIYALVNEGANILEEGIRPARGGHRHRLSHRLRLPRLSRRPDVVCRHGRAEEGLRPLLRIRSRAMESSGRPLRF